MQQGTSRVLRLPAQACSFGDDYAHVSTDGRAASDSSAATAVDNAVPPLQQSQQDRSGVASRFLDYDVFQRGEAHLPPTLRVPSLIPDYVKPFVDGHARFKQIATHYYQLVHPWLPIVSKRKVYDHLLNPLLPLRVDAVFLCLCMQLVSQPPETESPWTPQYRAATRFFTDVQAAGVLSMESLQGCILLATYEMGHAMYPAAEVSIGTCLKCALVLGMGWTASSKDALVAMSWADTEERRRTWWAIFILERTANLGRPQRELLAPEPTLAEQLPSQEKEWESGRPGDAVFTLSAPPESLGRYASVVQATYLLSRVFGHVQDLSVDVRLREEEMVQLDKTLHALILYSESNAGTTHSIICCQTAISFCALFTLSAPYLAHTEPTLRRHAEAVSDNAAYVALAVAEAYMGAPTMDMKYGDIPPFELPWLYMAGRWFLEKGSLRDFGAIERALTRLNTKWKSAGIYLELLVARRIMGPTPG
ncbi:Transcription factor [Niveomyces insectorum RCEF 264]|uniref:Transcription factor n=1 Tax=Niveomyces insectorum RCEF 264 TaxID=1081102 RepID=A0A167Z0W4_9HYPO|nr:Transcription factor [Niveomyces insectorum RCEF 264]